MSALILFRSLTYAQRGFFVLSRSGIPGKLIKAPRDLTDRGCAYGVLISDNRLAQAKEELAAQHAEYSSVWLRNALGEYHEAEP